MNKPQAVTVISFAACDYLSWFDLRSVWSSHSQLKCQSQNKVFLDSQRLALRHSALSKCFAAVGSIAGVVGSKHQVPLLARGLLVKSSVE